MKLREPNATPSCVGGFGKLQNLTEKGLPIHISQALFRDAAGSDANWLMRCMGIPNHVASGMDQVG